jgi:hypothetical protein
LTQFRCTLLLGRIILLDHFWAALFCWTKSSSNVFCRSCPITSCSSKLTMTSPALPPVSPPREPVSGVTSM